MTTRTSYTFDDLTNGVEYVVEILTVGAYIDDSKWVARSGTPTVTLELEPTSLSLVEGGAAKTYRVRMKFQPDVQVAVTPANGDATAVAVSPAQLDFAPADWNGWQTVTVTAPEDDDATGETVTVAHDVSGGYGRSSAVLTVSVNDNDTPGVVVEPLTLQVAEGGTATYRVKLATEPDAQVTVTATSDDTAAATAEPRRLTFATANWNVSQTVTVTGVEDYDADDEKVAISHAVAGYGTVTTAKTVTVDVDDLGKPGLTLDRKELAITEGATGTYTVVLDSPPAGDVTVRVTPAGPSSGLPQEVAAVVPGVNCCSPSTPPVVNEKTLTFTPSNWRVSQTVTVTGVENFDVQDLATEIEHSASGYGSGLVARLKVKVANNDLPGATLAPTALTIREGATADYVVRSHHYPGYAKVAGTTVPMQATVTPTSSDPQASVAVGQLKAIAGTSDRPPPPLVFTVTVAKDDDANNGTVTITHAYRTSYVDPHSASTVTVTDAPAVAVGSLTVAVLDPDVAPPTNVSVTPGDKRLVTSWKAPVYTGYLPVLRYKVSWRNYKENRPLPTRDLGWKEMTVSAEHTTAVISDLENGKKYEVRVRAENASKVSAWTKPVVGIPGRIGWVEFTRTELAVKEGDTAHLTVRRTLNTGNDLSHELAVPWEIQEGTAKRTTDFTDTAGYIRSFRNPDLQKYDEVVFGAGEATATISVPTRSDDDDEGDEDFRVLLRDPDPASGFGLRKKTAKVVIKERGTPVVQFAAAQVRHDETDADSVVSLAVNIDPPLPSDLTAAVTVTVGAGADADTAAAGTDYTTPPAALTLPTSTASTTLAVPVVGDRVIEGDETFTVTLTAVTDAPYTVGAADKAVVTIADNDRGVLALAIAAASVAEAPDAAFGVSVALNNSSGEDVTLPAPLAVTVTPTFTTGVGKAAAADLSDHAARTLTVATGAASVAASFAIADDTADEPAESLTFKLTATTPAGVTLGASAVTATITDDDATLVTAEDVVVAEDAGSAALALSIARVAGDGRVVKGTVTPTAGSAGAADYTAGAIAFTIAGTASTATVSIPITDDSLIEGEEQFTAAVAVTEPGDGSIAGGDPATVTITDDASLLALHITSARVAEAAGAAFELSVTLQNGEGEDLTLPRDLAVQVTPAFATGVGKAATADLSDSTARSLTIRTGVSSATTSFGIVDDTIDEPTEPLAFKLVSTPLVREFIGRLSGDFALGTAAVAASIEDNDATLVTAGDVAVAEAAGNAALALSITRVAGDSRLVKGTVTPTAGSAGAADYTAGALAFTIAATTSTTTVSIPITDDTLIEGREQFTATIAVTEPGDGSIAAGTAPTVTITDDDRGSLALAIDQASVAEAPGAAFALSVTLKNGAGEDRTLAKDLPVTVTPTFQTGTGKAEAADLTDSTAKTLTIATGVSSAAASFAIADDGKDEPAETLAFTLAAAATLPTGVTLGSPAEVAATINDPLALGAPASQVYTEGATIHPPLQLPAATGGVGAKTYTLTGPSETAVGTALPGLRFDARFRMLDGKPSAVKAPTTLTYTVTDGNGVSASATFTVQVVATPTLPDPADRTYVPTQTVRDVLPAATGGAAPLSYTLVGPEGVAVNTVLPGLSFAAGSRTLGGTAGAPKAAVTLTYKVSDKNGASATQTFTVTTAKAALVVTPTTTTRVYGEAEPSEYQYTVAAKSGSSFVAGDGASSTTFFTSSPLRRAAGNDVGEYAFSLVAAPAYGEGIAAKYLFEVASGAKYTITKKALSITTPVVLTKAYDGTTAAAGAALASGGAVSGAASGESFTLAVTGGTYSQSGVGTGLTISSPTFGLTAGNAASKTSNYRYTLPTAATGTITAKAVTVAAAVLTKEYDGGTAITGAELSGGAVSGAK